MEDYTYNFVPGKEGILQALPELLRVPALKKNLILIIIFFHQGLHFSRGNCFYIRHCVVYTGACGGSGADRAWSGEVPGGRGLSCNICFSHFLQSTAFTRSRKRFPRSTRDVATPFPSFAVKISLTGSSLLPILRGFTLIEISPWAMVGQTSSTARAPI